MEFAKREASNLLTSHSDPAWCRTLRCVAGDKIVGSLICTTSLPGQLPTQPRHNTCRARVPPRCDGVAAAIPGLPHEDHTRHTSPERSSFLTADYRARQDSHGIGSTPGLVHTKQHGFRLTAPLSRLPPRIRLCRGTPARKPSVALVCTGYTSDNMSGSSTNSA